MFELNGLVNENLQAVVKVELTNGSNLNCMIDTGFYGTLFLPRDFAEENSLEIIGQDILIAAEEQKFQVETALAEVRWLGDEFSLRVYISETDEALIGVEMLIDSVLEINYKNNTVKITK